MKQEHWLFDCTWFSLLWKQLVVCGAPHEPGLRWEVIDMGGGLDWSQKKEVSWEGLAMHLPPKELMPHAGVLAEIAHSPYWARSLYSFNGIPGIFVPGYMSVRKNEKIPRCHIESGEYLEPEYGEHVCIESWTTDFGHSYDAHCLGWKSATGKLIEGSISEFAVPVLMKS